MEKPTNLEYLLPADARLIIAERPSELRVDPDRLILTARGRGARDYIERWVARVRIATTPWSSRSDPHQISVLAHLPPDPRTRRKALAALQSLVEEQLPRANLFGRLSAAAHVGDRVEGLTGQIVVQFTPHVTASQVAQIARCHQLTPVRAVPFAGNCHVLEAAAIPMADLVETRSELAADPDVVFAEHDMVTIATKDASDFLLPEQRDLRWIGCPGAWARMPDSAPAGSAAITVAVIDPDGVDPDHPDLTDVLGDATPKQRANHDFVTGAKQQSRDLLGSHGTQCAATAVGGFDNAIGTAGVAGDCHLVAARVFDTPTHLEIADAWLWAAGLPTGSPSSSVAPRLTPGADVILNSWGISGPLPQVLRVAIDFITTFGRKGRGCVMCFSAGNNGAEDFAATRAAAAYERTIAVGASVNTDPTPPAKADTRAGYSPSGELDLVAPSSTTVGSAPLDPLVSATRVGFGAWTSARAVATTLRLATLPQASPTAVVAVKDVSGFEVNQRLLVGAPGQVDREFSAIKAIDATANTLELVHPLALAHGPGTQVSTGDGNHDRTAGGTSHAAALVAGAAALVLSAKPELTWRDVREILRRSATRIDPDQEDPVGQWVDRDGDGVREFSRWYGYGRLNVDEAVRMAQSYTPTEVIQLIDVIGAPPSAWPMPMPMPMIDAGACTKSWPCWLGLAGAIVAIAVALVMHCGDGDPAGRAVATQAAKSQACDLPRRARTDRCPTSGCGSNAGYLSGFVIDGLNVDGCRNYDGVRLVPDSVRHGTSACPDVAMRLDLVGRALVGRGVVDDEIVCKADDMGGVTFTVEGPAWALDLGDSEGVRTRELRIGATSFVKAWNAGTPEAVRTYAFEGVGGTGGQPCVSAKAWVEDWWDATPSSEYDAATPTPAVLVIGELYNPRSAQVKLHGPSASRWFNIACAGGALSKMRLLGLDPTQQSSTLDERQATLKMIMAKYCGATSYTQDGVPLQWTSSLGKTESKELEPQVGPVEAQWTAQGASCISHSRAWRHDQAAPTFSGVPDFATEAGLVELIRKACHIPACPEDSSTGTGADTGTVYWTTRTVNHVDQGG